jgi:hypothetical protein
MVGISTDGYSLYGIACIRCNDSLIAPDWSRYVSEHHISHFWSCESCGNHFETSDYLRLNAQPNETAFCLAWKSRNRNPDAVSARRAKQTG